MMFASGQYSSYESILVEYKNFISVFVGLMRSRFLALPKNFCLSVCSLDANNKCSFVVVDLREKAKLNFVLARL